MTDKQLFEAVANGDSNYLAALLSRKKEGLSSKNKAGQTLLHVAAACGHVQIAKILLQHEQHKRYENVKLPDEVFGHTPMHTACFFNQLKMVNFLSEQVVRQNLKEVLAIEDKSGWTCLHHAAKNGNAELCKVLLQMVAKPEATNKVGRQPIHYAAEEGHAHVVEVLMDHMGDKAIRQPVADQNGMNILHCAARRNQVAVVEFLKSKCYPPHHECTIIKNLVTKDKDQARLAEDLARQMNHKPLGAQLQQYRERYESWEAAMDQVEPLDRVKLCIIGDPEVGKTCLRASLGRSFFQAALLPEPKLEEEERKESVGIQIEDGVRIGNSTYAVWDFAGQLESYITHQLFITTNSTVYVAVVNLLSPLDDMRSQLIKWLRMIKVRNIGLLQYVQDPVHSKQDIKTLRQPEIVQETLEQARAETFSIAGRSLLREDRVLSLPAKVLQGRISPAHTVKPLTPSPLQPSWLQNVPVIVVGSHYDILQKEKSQMEVEHVVQEVQMLVNEVQLQFWPFLKVIPDIIPLNCLVSKGEEMQKLKDQLDKIRRTRVQYPHVVQAVSEKIAQFRAKNRATKVVKWKDVKKIVLEANGLLSDSQISFILRILHSTGHVVYTAPLPDYVFIDPAWLCSQILGSLLAPKYFKQATLAKVASDAKSEITEEEFQAHVQVDGVEKDQSDLILRLLLHMDLCWVDNSNGMCTYTFPGFIHQVFDRDTHWAMSPGAEDYDVFTGRLFQCSEKTDLLAPGFVARLAVYTKSIAGASVSVRAWKDCFLAQGEDMVQCLVSLDESSTGVEVRARTTQAHAERCLKLVEEIQKGMSQIIRSSCPNIFLSISILSVSDLRLYKWPTHAYPLETVVEAGCEHSTLVHPTTSAQESPLDLLFCGNEQCKKSRSSLATHIACLPKSLVDGLEELLSTEDKESHKDWKDLAILRGFGQYTQIFELKYHPVRYLLKKWGESPRWSVQALMAALEKLDRMDVVNFIRARFIDRR